MVTHDPPSEDLPEPGGAKTLRLRALDGYELGAVFYAAAGPRAPRRVAVFHGGAGISAPRYRRFAQFLANSGIHVLTYDYRGIGLSRPAALRGFRATMADWCDYDGAGAIAWLRGRFPRHEILGFSHSIGAFPMVGAPNATEQAGLVLIGPHTAYFGDYRARYRPGMTIFWHGLMPAVTRILGYFPARRLGLGEDLPADIALHWAARRAGNLRPSSPGAEHERMRRILDRCAALERPALAITVSDDALATVAGATRVLACFQRLRAQQVVLGPAHAKARRLGHFGFFRRDAGAILWPRLLALLEGKS